MLTVHDSAADVLAITLEGSLTGDDLTRVLDRLEPMLEAGAKANLFIETRGIAGLQLSALPAYVARAMPLLGKLDRFGRVALLADQMWIRAATRAESAFLPFITYRVFEPADRAEALAWVEGRELGGLAFDHHFGAHLRQRIELLGEFDRQPDAAMAGGIARQRAAVEGDAHLVVHLHVGHRRIVVFAAEALHLLAEHLPVAKRGFLALLARRDGADPTSVSPL